MTASPDALREALDDARDRIRESLRIGAPGLSECSRDALLRSIMLKVKRGVLAPIFAQAEADRAEIERLREQLAAAVIEVGNQARARGEAEGALRVSEMAGIVDGWRDRATAAEARLAALSGKVETLRAERDEARQALAPFAEYARLSEEAGPDIGEGEIGEFIHRGFRRSISTRDLRAARDALAPADNREGRTG